MPSEDFSLVAYIVGRSDKAFALMCSTNCRSGKILPIVPFWWWPSVAIRRAFRTSFSSAFQDGISTASPRVERTFGQTLCTCPLRKEAWMLFHDFYHLIEWRPFPLRWTRKGQNRQIIRKWCSSANIKPLSRDFSTENWKSKLSSFAARKRSIGNQRTKLLHMSAPQGSAVDKMAVKKRTIGQSVCTDPLRGSVWFHQFWSRNFSGSKVDSKWSCSLGLILVWLS